MRQSRDVIAGPGSERSPLLMTQQATATARKTSAASAGMPNRARTAAGSIPAAGRPASRHLASFAKGTEVVVSALLRLT